ncbi:hypothetical protein UlMin_039669 [Ulmus minor]
MLITFSQKPSTRFNIRSITLPTRSHPTTHKIEQELNKLKAWEATTTPTKASTICSALLGLKELYSSIGDLLSLPLTQQALSQHQDEKWVHELVDGSLTHLDFCGNTRDAILMMKQSVRELQSAIRRRKVGDSNIESNVNEYMSFRKKLKKQLGLFMASLKQMDSKCGGLPLDLNSHLSAVVRALREASLITSSIFQSLSLFLSTPLLKSKPSKWSLVSIMVHKGVMANDTNQEKSKINELEMVDISLGNLFSNSSSEDAEEENFQLAQKKLEALDFVFEGLENGLECLYRLLIQNRVCLLNILSH